MVNPSKGTAHLVQELTDRESTLLQDFLAFSAHPNNSAELVELHLLSSLALACRREKTTC